MKNTRKSQGKRPNAAWRTMLPVAAWLALGAVPPVLAGEGGIPDTADTPWGVGLSALVAPNPYKDSKTTVWPVPVVSYDSEQYFIKGLGGGFYLWKDRQNVLSWTAYYSPLHFKPGDSDDSQVSQLDKRRATVMSGLNYRHHETWGDVHAALAADVLNNSNGLTGELGYRYRWHDGAWSLAPGIGVSWENANTARYYYGISQTESANSGLAAYSPGNSWNPYVEVSGEYAFSEDWQAFVTARYTHLASGIRDSPMVDSSGMAMLWTGVSYRF